MHPVPPAEPSGTRRTAAVPVLYRDPWVIAVHKPAGLLVHRSPLSRDEEFLLQRLRNQVGQRIYPVHRLDRATSGVMVFATTPAAARSLALAFREHRVRKHYLAVTRGYTPPAGPIDHPLRTGPGRDPQPAVTEYRRLATVELPFAVGRYPTSRYSLVAVHPVSGRRHQIRRHFAHIAHPLIGDTAYGKGEHNRLFRREFGLHRLLLVATHLTFPHPEDGRLLRLGTACDPELLELFVRLGWDSVVPGQGPADAAV